VPLLLGYDELFEEHVAGRGHPDRPERVTAVLDGIRDAKLDEGLVIFTPRPATETELLRVHTPVHIATVAATEGVGGMLDSDTGTSPQSYRSALVAAGAGIDAACRMRRGEGDAAFLVTRPPGHHALADRAMGFCLFNSVAVTAASLVGQGERVLVVDWDAHHGNGTQSIFYDSSDVLFISFHQYPLYPGSGAVSELGEGAGIGTTINIPLPAFSSGDAFRMGFDEIVIPAVELFSPTWLLVSCGFDAHRDDPLTQLGLAANDFADITARVMGLVLPERRIFFLEGGYDLNALGLGAGAVVSTLLGGHFRPERGTSRVDGERVGDGPVGVVIAQLADRLSALGRL
jgi:acetoin utilization deacetylase AcuC-like enzyme